jgi:DNA polymerase I-like protein with 3'-5' exonuclease and polymerase domains
METKTTNSGPDVFLDAAVPVTYVTSTSSALAAMARLKQAAWVGSDTETVARHPDGSLRDLDVDGPGALRVLSAAGWFETETGPVVEAYVFDFGHQVPVDPATAERFPTDTTTTSIDRTAFAAAVKDCSWFFWNADFDEKVLEEAGMLPAKLEDLMLYEASLVLGSSGVSWYDSLSTVSQRYLGIDIEGKGTVQLSYTADQPLDIDQVRYAAADVIATARLVEIYRDLVAKANLTDAVDLECGARPFRARMERVGIPLDADGWRSELVKTAAKIEAIEAELAALTGGGQANLFDAIERPTWNPASAEDVKKALNAYATDAVQAHLGGRLFEKADRVEAATLQLLRHPLADAILKHRDYAKTISTYGEKFLTNVRADGRVHARYVQNIVSTGRLSSSKPNMQNLDPAMKPYYRPSDRPLRDADGNWELRAGQRVFVLGDLGQAELRYAAQVSGDPALIEAFEQGLDMHSVTASRMFKVDMDALKAADPKEHKVYRQRGKTMNFAVIYGLGPRALAQTLTVAGVPTTPDEAAELLRLYLEAFPEVAKWLAGRDAYIGALVKSPPRCDFDRTLRLHRLFPKMTVARKQLKEQLGRTPTPSEIVEHISPVTEVRADLERKLGYAPDDAQLDEELGRRRDVVVWASSFKVPVVVLADGSPFMFESRTSVGRRRIFNVTTEQWMMSMIMSVVTARKGPNVKVRETFEAANENVKLLQASGKTLTRDQVKKKFEDKELKSSFIAHIFRSLGPGAQDACYAALTDCIGGLGNAYRNAPIQGGVADAVLRAYQLLNERLVRFTNAVPVQSVHDSIVLEVNAEEALEVAQVLKETMEEGLKHFCPDVPAKADVDIAASLDADKDGIDADLLESSLG